MPSRLTSWYSEVAVLSLSLIIAKRSVLESSRKSCFAVRPMASRAATHSPAEAPASGTELSNPALAKALAGKLGREEPLKFTRDEFDAFGVSDLKWESYVRAGTEYFKPLKKKAAAKKKGPVDDEVLEIPAWAQQQLAQGGGKLDYRE